MIKEFNTLREFLNMSVFSTDEVFHKFNSDIGGNLFEINGQKFYFKPGKREDRILLVAHADTVWDERYKDIGLVDKKYWEKIEEEGKKQERVVEKFDKFCSGSKYYGIGADDRAGAAIVWLLKDTGNSVLITDTEEIGALSAYNLMQDDYFRDIINSHRYILQFDLNGKNQFKCYSAGNEDFKVMMEIRTKSDMLPNFSFTDVAILGNKICGANLATGYKYEHTPFEYLNKKDWYKCYKIAKKLANDKHQQFYVDPEFGFKYMKDEDKLEIFNQMKLEENNLENLELKENNEKVEEQEIEKM